MNNSEIFKRFLLLFIVGVLVYFAWIIYRDSRETPEFESTDPQLELYQYEVMRYNQDGFLEYLLEGEVLTHYEDERGSELTHPKLSHYEQTSFVEQQNEMPVDWQAESLMATISEDKSLVTLNKEVVLHKPNLKDPQNAITMATERLYIHDRGEKISSDVFVKITTPSRTVSGMGVEGFPDKEQFTILRDVHSTFMTNQEIPNE